MRLWHTAEGRRTISAHHLSGLDLLKEEGLLVFSAGGEALLLGLIDSLLNTLALGLCAGLGQIFLSARLPALVATQLSPELSVVAPLVVEVGGIGCRWGRHRSERVQVPEVKFDSRKAWPRVSQRARIPRTPAASVATAAVATMAGLGDDDMVGDVQCADDESRIERKSGGVDGGTGFEAERKT